MTQNDKPKGKCPFCFEIMQPNILEVNVLRRDKCECPLCYEIVYICRMPSCNHYAKGGDYYDDEFCPNCKDFFAIDTATGYDNNVTSQPVVTTKVNEDKKLFQTTTSGNVVKSKGNKAKEPQSSDKNVSGGETSDLGSVNDGGVDDSSMLDALSDIAKIFVD